jgi:hypothetical protein
MGKSSSNAPLIGAAAGGVLAQGAGIGAIGCSPEDKSFYCQSSRFVMIAKNILFMVLLAVLAYYLFKNRKKFMGK